MSLGTNVIVVTIHIVTIEETTKQFGFIEATLTNVLLRQPSFFREDILTRRE